MNKDALIAELADENRRYMRALRKISKWFNEFPQAIDSQTGKPIPYGCAYGSNGERDFMRKVANDALDGKGC